MNTQKSSLAGEVALVTGASRGIGAAVALRFAERGAKVIVTHRDSAGEADAVVASLPGEGHRAVKADVSDSGALADLADSVRGQEGRLSYLVNNAGWTTAIPHHKLDELTDEIMLKTFEVNTFGVFRACRALGPIIRETGGGAIVNISSVAASIGMGSSVAYCASKLAVESMTQTLARVFCPEVRVMAVAPGLTATDMIKMWTPEEQQKRAQMNAMKRIAAPAEVAEAVVATAADFTYSTGSVIKIEGGRALF